MNLASPAGRLEEVGCLTFVTGTTAGSSSRRVVGLQKTNPTKEIIKPGDIVEVYEHTIATIPDGISDGDAMSTAAASVVGVHCAIPKVEKVGGGSDDDVFYSGKAIVMGGNDYSNFLADGLATLGIDVSLVSTGGINARNKQVNVMKPAVGEDELGFSTAVGQFDSLIDTIGNERKGISITSENPRGGSSVLQLLQERHSCAKYVSTQTHAQQIIMNEGVIFGPGKANSYLKSMESLSTKQYINLIPCARFGKYTLQVLLDNRVVFPAKDKKLTTIVRGWAIKNFWEETSWPRDSSGMGVRYGLPVGEEEDLDELFQLEQLDLLRQPKTGVDSEQDTDNMEVQIQTNPYVTQIVGVEGLAENIIAKQKNCVVFVSMRSCRTCKSINPIFTKIAREYDGSNLMFAKADATGIRGKALGKQLGVISVPSFVLFRKGIRYGAVATAKLPSDRLGKAIRDLEAGEDFDTALEDEEDD